MVTGGTTILYICSHGTSDMTFIYNEVLGWRGPNEGVWIYFPMNQGESLQAIFSRTSEGPVRSDAYTSLIVSCKTSSV